MYLNKMSINFDRNSSQVLFESFINISGPDELKTRKYDFENHILNRVEAQGLKLSLKTDACNFFFNGALSFAEAIDELCNKHFSWATVKLYYSIYYLLRASLATKEIVILQCCGMYRLITEPGEKPYRTRNKKYNTTHEGTINHYRDLYERADRLLANKIGDVDAYQWMMQMREIVNYRSSVFKEPDCLQMWEYIGQYINEGKFEEIIKTLENDNYIMCFQEEYAVLAIPIKRLQETIMDMLDAQLLNDYSSDKLEFVKETVKNDDIELVFLTEIL